MPVEHLDTATILQLRPGYRACKAWRWTGKSWLKDDYSLGYLTTSYAVPLDGLEDVRDMLAYLSGRSDRCVIRGEAIDPEHARRILHRRLSEVAPVDRRQPDGAAEGPYYRETDHRWLMVDLDTGQLPVDPWAEVDGRPRAVWAALDLLPAPFRAPGVGVVWQWSSSAGFSSALKVHLWFWLSRAACDRSLREWNKRHCYGLDATVWRAVQPHYTADPLITGAPDPLPIPRVGWAQGGDVDLPAEVLSWRNQQRADAREEAERKRRVQRARAHWRLLRERGAKRGDARLQRMTLYVERALEDAVAQILTAEVGGRHDVICSQSYATAQLVRAGQLDELLWREALCGAGVAAVGEARRQEVEDLINSALNRAPVRDLSHVGQEVGR